MAFGNGNKWNVFQCFIPDYCSLATMQIGGWTALWSCPRRCLGCPESWKKELINDRLKIKYKVYTIRVFHEHYALNSLTEYFFCWRYHKSAAHFQYFPSTHPHIMLFYSLQFCNVFHPFAHSVEAIIFIIDRRSCQQAINARQTLETLEKCWTENCKDATLCWLNKNCYFFIIIFLVEW